MMVLNMRDKKVRLGLGASLLVMTLVLFVSAWIYSGAKSEQPVSSQGLEKEIVSKLDEKKAQKGFFAQYRMERESLRGLQREMLTQILNDSAADKTVRQAASIRLTQIGEEMEKEMKMESLIKSKGYEDCVVIPQNDALTVVISASHLSSEQENDVRQVVGKTKTPGGKVMITLIEP